MVTIGREYGLHSWQLGNNWRRIRLFRHLEMFTDRDSKDDKESLTQRALRLEERKMVTLPNNEH